MLRVEYALTSDRTMKALTGLTRPEFRALVPAFGQALYDQALQRDPPRQRRPGGGGPATLKTAAAKLFFILIYVKCYPTFDVAAVLYGVHRSRAHRWTQDLLPVLEQTLGYQMILPERQIHEVEGFSQRFPTAQTLFVDGDVQGLASTRSATRRRHLLDRCRFSRATHRLSSVSRHPTPEETTRQGTQRPGSLVQHITGPDSHRCRTCHWRRQTLWSGGADLSKSGRRFRGSTHPSGLRIMELALGTGQVKKRKQEPA